MAAPDSRRRIPVQQERERRPESSVCSPRMRIRAPLLLSTLLLGALTGCSSTADPALLEGNIVRPGNFRAGSGVITSVGVLRGAGSGSEPHRYRLYLMMDAGGFQSCRVDENVRAAGFRLNETETLLTVVKLHCSCGCHLGLRYTR